MYRRLLYLLCALWCLNACKEVGPPGFHIAQPVDTTGLKGTPDTAVAQKKMVLLEDMTGVRCPNCPQGKAVAEQLISTYPGQVAVVEVHGANFLTTPYPGDSTIDNADADAVDSYVGPSSFKPAGAIDRIADPGNNLLFDRSVWPSNVQTRLNVANPMNIYFVKVYTPGTRLIQVKVCVKYTQTVADTEYLHVFLVQDSIKTKQDDSQNPNSPDTGFYHDNVLRKIMTNSGVGGDLMVTAKTKGTLYTNIYSYTIPPYCNVAHCKIVAFVSSGTKKEILQAQVTPVQ